MIRETVIAAIANVCYLSSVSSEPLFTCDADTEEDTELNEVVSEAFEELAPVDNAQRIVYLLNQMNVCQDEVAEGVSEFLASGYCHDEEPTAESYFHMLKNLYSLVVID